MFSCGILLLLVILIVRSGEKNMEFCCWCVMFLLAENVLDEGTFIAYCTGTLIDLE